MCYKRGQGSDYGRIKRPMTKLGGSKMVFKAAVEFQVSKKIYIFCCKTDIFKVGH